MRIDYEFNFEYFKTAADYVKKIVPEEPEIAIILGSGLGPLAEMIDDPIEIRYADIPNFLISTVDDHAGKLIFGTVKGRKIVCMSGRFHYYEGYDFEQLVIPIRLFKLLGVKATILTNACGAVNTAYHPGDVMIISDHIKLIGASPLRGPNIEEFGHRFFDTSLMYTPELRKIARDCGRGSALVFHEGVYMYFKGPQFETPAEIRAARVLGADVVGMSTVTEALTAAHCNMPLLALATVTNMAAGVVSVDPISSFDVNEVAAIISDDLSVYMIELIEKIGKEYIDEQTV